MAASPHARMRGRLLVACSGTWTETKIDPGNRAGTRAVRRTTEGPRLGRPEVPAERRECRNSSAGMALCAGDVPIPLSATVYFVPGLGRTGAGALYWMLRGPDIAD